MRVKPGQTAPQMLPRGPKGPIKKPIVAQQTTAAPVGRTKGGIGMTGGPKPKPTAQMAGANRAFQAAQKLATPQRTQSVMKAAMSGAGATPQRMQGLGAAIAKGPAAPATQSGREQAMQGAAASNAFKNYKAAQAGRVGVGAQRAFGAKKGGAVPSKMGAVKTSASRDGVAKKGKTKGRMV